MNRVDELQAWRGSASRVTLRPAWPVPIELDVALNRQFGAVAVVLSYIVHARNASDVLETDPAVPWTMIPVTCFMFSMIVPDDDAFSPGAPDGESARLQHVIAYLREVVMHELDEFLLVDGRVAQPPHQSSRIRHDDETSTWRAAISRVSLHPAFGLEVDLRLDEAGLAEIGSATIGCSVRHSDPGLAATIRRAAPTRDEPGKIQQLLGLVRLAVRGLLDECLIVDHRIPE